MSTSVAIHLASVASAFGSSALLLPFSAGLAFFCLGAFLAADGFLVLISPSGFGGFVANRTDLRCSPQVVLVLPMLVARNAEGVGKKSQKNSTVKTALDREITHDKRPLSV